MSCSVYIYTFWIIFLISYNHLVFYQKEIDKLAWKLIVDYKQ